MILIGSVTPGTTVDLKIKIYEEGTPYSDGPALTTAAPATNETYTKIVIPAVITTDASNIVGLTTTLGGNVTDDAGISVTERGIVYSATDTTPEIGETGVIKDTNGTGTGIFTENITGLTENTLYYYNAYAINSDTGYGDVKTFTTLNVAKIVSIERQNPTAEITNSSTVLFRTTFDSPVNNVDITDFTVNSPTGSINSVTPINTSVYDVEIIGLATAGTIGLDIKGVAGTTGSNDILTVNGDGIPETLSVDQTVDNNWFNQDKLGQTFTATASNNLTKFTLYPKVDVHTFSGTADLKIYSGDETTGTATLLSTESITITNSTASAGQTFTLSTPQSVTAGNIYSIVLDNFTGSGARAFGTSHDGVTDAYTGGHIIYDSLGAGTIIDLKIKIYAAGTPFFNGSPLATTAPTTNETYTKTTAKIISIERQNPTTEEIRANIVTFRTTFDTHVKNVDATDFTLNATSGSINSVTPINGSVYDVEIIGLSTSGSIGLSIKGVDNVTGTNDILTQYGTEVLSVNQTADNNYFNQPKVGQTFTATALNLTKFTLYPKVGQHTFSGTADLKIYSGDETTGTATLLSTQSITITPNTDSAGQTFALNTPQSVITGNIYSIVLDNFAGSGDRAFGAFTTTDQYPGGHLIFTGYNAGNHNHYDLTIKIYESGAPFVDGPALATTAPTTNETYTRIATPIVTTTTSSNVTAAFATLGGDVTDDAGFAIT